MRRISILAVSVCALLVAAAVAMAAQVNTYTVGGSMSPSKAGTKKKPVPVAVKFSYTVSEASGQRPGLVKSYAIAFDGLKVNGARFPKCTATAINAAGSDAGCSPKSLVGTGSVENQAGPSNDPANKSIACHLDLKVYNSGQGKGALYLRGTPPTCPLALSQAIDAKFVPTSKGTTLKFDVNGTLLNPVQGLDNAVVQVSSSIKKLTTTYRGKKVGYFESAGGCTKRKRNITVTFTTTNGQTGKAKKSLKCS
jgi:hypothetical protein